MCWASWTPRRNELEHGHVTYHGHVKSVGDLLRGVGGRRLWVVEMWDGKRWVFYSVSVTRQQARVELGLMREMMPANHYRLRPYRREGK